jgi:cystathionine beta-lyase/cystathionine gamma-synthase
MTTTYAQNSPGNPYNKFEYSRCGNPSIDSFEKQMAKAEFGNHGLLFSSGCAAINAIFMTLKSGDHILSCDDVYGGTNRMLNKVFKKFGLENSMIDMSDLDVVK